MRGPVTGPFIGAILHILKARARWSSVTTSYTVPGEVAVIAEPAKALYAYQLTCNYL
jgi:hypothetical protein